MRTKKHSGLIAACLGLLAFGLILLDWVIWVFIASLVLILFISYMLFYPKEINVEIVREISNVKIFENDEAEVTLKIKNKGKTLSFLEIFDLLPDRIKIGKGSNYALVSLRENEEITIKYTVICPIRGHYQIGPLHLRMRDYFSFFVEEKIVDDDAKITVIPRVEEIKGFTTRSKVNPFPGLLKTNYAGSGIEFHSIRRYTPGDSYKKINWKAFARWNNVMVNEFEMESTTDVIIILDSREIENIGTLKHNPLEYNIKAAISLTSYYLKKRDRVGLIIYGQTDSKLKWIYPESGKKQLYKIIKEVVETQPEGDISLSSVVDTATLYMIPQKSLVILISSLQNDSTISEALIKLIARKFRVYVISPSSLDIEYSLQTYDPIFELAYKILKFERKNYLSRLRNTGAVIVDWNPSLPLSLSLKEVEQYRIRY